MTTTADQIDRWLTEPSENHHLEFKQAKTQFSQDKLYQYCVALANEGGGHLLLGVTDKRPRRVVGTTAANDPMGMEQKLHASLKFRVDVEEVHHPRGRVVVFHIPPRPRGTAYHIEGRYLMRSGEQLMPMSEDQLRRIFAEGQPDWLEEVSRENVDASGVVKLLDTQSYFDLVGRPLPSTRAGILDQLISERLVRDRGDDTYSIVRLGALLLAKSLKDFPDVQAQTPRVVVFPGTSKLETRLDERGSKGYAVGFQGLVGFVMAQLPQNEVVQDALRREVKLVPEIAIRELVANALVHQDFTMGGASVMVEIYGNRVEISNPGEPIVPVERFIDGYQSRNERLADLMRRMGICEEKSSGVDKVIDAAEVAQLPAPDFRVGFQRTEVVLHGPMPFERMSKDDRVRACYQHCALRRMMSQHMTNQSLRGRFHLPKGKTAIVSQIINATVEAGLVKPDESVGGSRRLSRYLPFWA